MRKKSEQDIPLEARVSDIRHNRGIFVYCHASGGLLAYAVRKVWAARTTRFHSYRG